METAGNATAPHRRSSRAGPPGASDPLVVQNPIGLVVLGVEVALEVQGDGLQQQPVRLGAAGAEGHEAAAIRPHERRGRADDRPAAGGGRVGERMRSR